MFSVKRLTTAALLVLVSVPLAATTSTWGTCGGFLDLSVTPEGTITSPGHGESASYDDEEYCVWLLQAPLGHRVRLTVNYVLLEATFYGRRVRCRDYVQICDGPCSNTRQLYYHCAHDNNDPATPVAVKTSSSRWLGIKFKSDHSISGNGFNMSYTTTPGQPGDTQTPPFISCSRSYQWQCGNKECVLTSRLCDGYDQCGDNSDETLSRCGPATTTSPRQASRATVASSSSQSTRRAYFRPIDYNDGTLSPSGTNKNGFGTVTLSYWTVILIIGGVLALIAIIIFVLQVVHRQQKKKLRREMAGGTVRYTPNNGASLSRPGGNRSSANQTQATRQDINGRSVLPPIVTDRSHQDIFTVVAPPPYQSRVNLREDEQAIAPPPYVTDTSDQSEPPKVSLPGGDTPGVYLDHRTQTEKQ
ncbi:uncharacterized protein LOC106179025 [Lingula anatina]|uniref:Uncharacterized protein LOC106179025 n=1 Tax=Lingula anatina TaxID=7574 RepID=A0A1S3K6T6_LINAN|nr:uncharacterized protein LOC106179025 [Lingula anatina]XP_013417966.1 uncharacterized protein LOC106179025 [Lingula anatina]|eukprot:XP_013417965.1 uncharacterized protein LOC106179025 [Lingula anatina]